MLEEKNNFLERFLHLHPKGIDLSLGRILRLLEKLGAPHKRLPPVVHVAGTNGKGSTVAYIRAILESSGLLVHTYTSPHLVSFCERIRLGSLGGGQLIAEEELISLLKICEDANDGQPITFFEITTAAAFLAFSRHKADYLVLEVGLGGRLDATNVIQSPKVCAISALGYDHEAYLGTTLQAIAQEKAGIFKEGSIGVIGAQESSEALKTLEKCAFKKRVPLLEYGRDWHTYAERDRMVFEDANQVLDLPCPSLPGKFQIENAGLAIASVLALGEKKVDVHAIAQGISCASWPARLQKLPLSSFDHFGFFFPPGSEIWLDGGHNPAAAERVAEMFQTRTKKTQLPFYLISGMLNTKDPKGYFKAFWGQVKKVYTIDIPGEKNALKAEELAQHATSIGLAAQPSPSLEQALAAILEEANTPLCLLIGGSLYLAGQVLKQTGHLPN